jgi:hypothetical protein
MIGCIKSAARSVCAAPYSSEGRAKELQSHSIYRRTIGNCDRGIFELLIRQADIFSNKKGHECGKKCAHRDGNTRYFGDNFGDRPLPIFYTIADNSYESERFSRVE